MPILLGQLFRRVFFPDFAFPSSLIRQARSQDIFSETLRSKLLPNHIAANRLH